MKIFAALTTAFILALLAIVPATAATVSMETYADAWGLSIYYNENWNADTNYGAQTDAYGTVMQCMWRPESPYGSQKFWTKFDLSSFTGSADNVTLQMTRTGYATDGYDAILVYALNDGDEGEGWGEYTITYNNAPGNILDANQFDTGRWTYVGALDYVAGGEVGDVITLSGEALQQAVNDDTDGRLTLGFLKKMYNYNGAAFASREDAFYPGATLVVEGVTAVVNPLPGDANGDTFVNAADAAILAEYWLTASGAVWRMGDFNSDGAVNDIDAALMAANWQATSQSSSVPEPSTVALLAGLLTLALAARCKR